MKMDIRINDGEHIEARFDGLTVSTAQDGSQPAPFDLFLASIGTCGAYYLAKFCHQRKIPTTGIRITQTTDRTAGSCLVSRVQLAISLPDDFPEKYRKAAVRATESCTVKKHLATPPLIDVHLETAAAISD